MRVIVFPIVSIVILFISLLSGCITITPQASVILEDEEIEASLISDIYDLNSNIVNALQNEDVDSFLGYFSTDKADESEFASQVTDIFPQMCAVAKGKEFVDYHDYYCKSSSEGSRFVTIPEDKYDYMLSINAIQNTMFVSLMHTPAEFNVFLLSMAYIKADREYQLYYCHIGSFIIAEKNAVHWYDEAVEYYQQGYLVPAAFRVQMSNQCLYPAPFIQYKDAREIEDFMKQLLDEISNEYSFPITLSTVEGSPVIYQLEPKFVQSDIVTRIKYVTSHSLENVDDLKTEAYAMSPIVQELFPGIKGETGYLVFQAFSEPPVDPLKIYDTYSTVVEDD